MLKLSSQLVLSRQCMENRMVRVFTARHIFRVVPMRFTVVSGISVPAPRMWSTFTTWNVVNETNRFEMRLGEVTDDEETTLAVVSFMSENLLTFRFRGAMLGLLVAVENINVDEVTIVHASARKAAKVDGDESRAAGPWTSLQCNLCTRRMGALEKVQAGLHRQYRHTSVARVARVRIGRRMVARSEKKTQRKVERVQKQSLLELSTDWTHCTERER